MNIINKDYRKTYNNPYRHGVLIGNCNEDSFGQELVNKHNQDRISQNHFISEKMDKFTWPQLQEKHVKVVKNELTSKFNSNFDFNIDFSQKNLEEYLKLQELNEFELKDKNSFLPEQINSETQIKKMIETSTGQFESKSIKNETQNMLNSFHQKDSRGLLYTKKSGLVKDLFFGHGLEITGKNSNKNEYVSTNQ